MFPRGRTCVTIFCAGLGALLLSLIAKAQPNYLIPLPQKGNAIALNNSGQVLFETGLLTGNTFAAFPAGFTAATDLSESGVVAGTTSTGHLATYSAGTVADLGLPPVQGVPIVMPAAINASGQIVGYSSSGLYGFLYSGGVFNPINSAQLTDKSPPLPTDINDSGQVVLSGASSASPCRGFLITGAVLTDLGSVCPVAINAGSQITGMTLDASGKHWRTFIWTDGNSTLLAEPAPFTDSQGYTINKGGQIVGLMSAPIASGGWSSVPFFYNGVMTDINSLISASDPLKSSATIGSVVDINDSRLLLLVSTVPVVGSRTAYLLQAPWLDVAPGPLTFTSQTVGTTSQPQTLTLTNSGTMPLALDRISIAPGTAAFSQTNACPQSLAAGANCTVSVTFSPSTAGNQNAVLDVVTDGATITVSLSGTTPITISFSANPTRPTVGQPFTISWTATPGTTCQSSGGAASDGWSATTASGSVSVIEAAAGMYTYNLTCTAGSVSAAQSLKVTVANPPASGGGGGLDVGSLLLLVGLLARYYRAISR
jgi:hypothetical protein